MIDVFSGDSLNAKIIRHLVRKGEPQRWSDFRDAIANKDGFSGMGISRSLNIMERYGVIKRVRDGRTDYFYISREFYAAVKKFMDSARPNEARIVHE